ncbi:MAG: L,D-transpeptidase family protein [Gammaproteobacteria bacterium]|nr:L,D-transpeptidase family protein [Gammaproteobacteria bacterium]
MIRENQNYSTWIVLALLICFSQCVFVINAQASEDKILQQQLQNSENGRFMFADSEIAVLGTVRDMYQYNGYQLLWQKQSMIDILLKAIDDSYQLGLEPQDYHRDALTARLKNGLLKKISGQADIEQAQLDIMLTDALLRLAYHLNFGKVVPVTLDPDWNLRREFLTRDPVAKLNYVLGSEKKLEQFLEQSVEQGILYKGLIKAMAQYRQIQQDGGWNEIPSGVVLKPGMQDSRVPLIQARLQVSGDLKKNIIEAADHNYSERIEAGVKAFQYRHNLEVDGVIGKGTLEQMNVSVESRIEQIRANLERIRWVKRNLGDEFVLVNIAGFKVYYFQDNKLIWQSRAQVGTDYRKTPVFRDDINYLVFNPTWTVPPTILSKDILPKLKKDSGYLQKKNMNVINSKGKIIDASKINWSTMTAKKFPYMIRQEPGPSNALGRVKIMFPNKHLVYLHDTPSKSKFKRTERAFSSGCIRVENPFELAELLLKDSDKWNQQSFAEMLATGKLKNVNLPEKVPVLLLYFTTQIDENGKMIFYKDIYNRDEKIIKGLKEPFKLVIPDQKQG